MILVRIYDGIRDHFPARASEWHMVYPAVFIGLALSWQPDLFASSAAFGIIAAWMGEAGWSALFLTCGLLRLVALTVNGTFRTFRHTPMIRFFVAMVTALAWGQFCLGFLIEWLETGHAALFAGLLSHLVLVECLNVYRSSRDWAGAAHDRMAQG